jgi:FkbM family methyltransferase
MEVRGIKVKLRKNTDDYDIMIQNDENEISKFLKLQKGDTFIDIGANIGRYTIEIAKSYCHDGVHVVSIEPSPLTFMALHENVLINELNNVLLINKAVFNKKEKIPFYQVENLSDFDSMYRKYGKMVMVDADTIDGILCDNHIQKADVIKMDVEGAELDALMGSEKTLKKTRTIVVEVHNQDVNNYGGYEKIKDVLENNGFHVDKIGSKFIFAVGNKEIHN